MRILHWSWIAVCVTCQTLVAPLPAARAAQTDEQAVVRLIATGGTIANRAGSRLTADELSASVPALDGQVVVETEQFSNVASGALTLDDWLRLARRVNETFAERDDLAGVVVTSGTDTLEETAYFLNLTVRSERPVVVVGAMRQPGSVGYDGAANLLQGLRVAGDPASRGRGVLVVLNNEINAARDVTKTHAQRLHAFTAGVKGVLGVVDRDRVIFYRRPLHRHTRWAEFDLAGVERLPRVDILMTYLAATGDLVRAAVDAGAEGLVVAAAGAGSTTEDQAVAIGEALDRGRPVVITTRTGGGRIVPRRPRPDADAAPEDPRYSPLRVEAEDLSPVKARILLMLALTRTRDGTAIQRMFQQY
jgi:L-asparaginase